MDPDLELHPATRAEIDALARRYLWWEPPSGSHSAVRTVAQIMNLGTYEDILRLESLLPSEDLLRVMANAQPGWLSPRSWEFWRGRLGGNLPETPPVRSFADAS
jgi:hypothetical protein